MIYKLIFFFFSMSIFSCNSTKEVSTTEKEVKESNELQGEDLVIKEIYYQKWMAGIKGGGSGINLHFTLEKKLERGINIYKIQIENIETTTIKKIDELNYVASFETKQNDLNLDEDPLKEYGNEAPKQKTTNLKKGQVKIFLMKDSKTFYKIIDDVKEKPTIAYPSMKPQNNDE
ncbi:hypothetical protein [Flavobacterium sp. HNIBRBA15423]|uniref:hypothetical protein n=1 Tax=Flavobacterium sp. HNIBRBA15423 TaxID=3458683 RepID=UPI0040441055